MICVSIAEPTVEDALTTLAQAEAQADLCEIRLDALEEPAVAPFLPARRKPLLFTFRAEDEGGFRSVPLPQRLRWLSEAASAGADYVDIELAAGPEAIRELHKISRTTRLILSYHNFKNTPKEDYLKDKIKEMVELGAAIGKVVCMAKEVEDGLRLLGLISWARRRFDFPLIAFAMGPLGKWTRVVSVLLGAPFTYAAAKPSGATAPGQLTVEELRRALDLISGERIS
ncbi:type I 3-dehydroquinate dehydratase [Thermosulfurimonas sp. F29]|uniref:type I 3-dehydroquinate dehydratase n=1 Tax=Thermosulfurimonas sp. F29 TaxID=2867247 RepID=UPI001C8291E5|nr:type I 3-dehydroquinate dehydratase [Thermosulfurimonas sp. F29]MBX6423517.1 type I 3-dehydroquinate dehydratase [Thermosulfurimonas sp. F29]